MKLYHGDDTAASRQALVEFRQAQADSGRETVVFDGKQLKLADLRQAMESMDLLGANRAVIVEGLFAAPKSKRLEEILEYLKSSSSSDNLLLWEKKKINANRFKPLKAQAREFSLPKLLFNWLEGIAPNSPQSNLRLYRQLLSSQPAEVLGFMLARQLRQLLTAKFEPELLSGPGWLQGKIKRQADTFSQHQLLNWHRRQYQIDKEIKTGQSLLSLDERLAQLLLSI